MGSYICVCACVCLYYMKCTIERKMEKKGDQFGKNEKY